MNKDTNSVDTKAMWAYFSPILDNRNVVPFNERDYFKKMVKEKYGLIDFEFNNNGGITVDWEYLIQTYYNQIHDCIPQ